MSVAVDDTAVPFSSLPLAVKTAVPPGKSGAPLVCSSQSYCCRLVSEAPAGTRSVGAAVPVKEPEMDLTTSWLLTSLPADVVTIFDR